MHEDIWALDTIYRHAWDCLCIEVDHGANPFRLMQFATVGLNGFPRVRTVVLRRADRGAGTLTFHTDIRSDKFAELQVNPRVSLVGMDTIRNVQIRIEGEAVLFTDGSERKSAWDASRKYSKRLYQGGTPPGTPIEAPPQVYLNTMSGQGFEHFCLVVVSIRQMEWLDLSTDIHQRALCRRTGSIWHCQWIAP
jgi:hypothetical protein